MSLLVGEYDKEVWGGSFTNTGAVFSKSKEWNASQSWTRVPKLPPDQIYRGNPNDPDACLAFTPRGGWTWTTAQHYWRTGMWPSYFMQSASRALHFKVIADLGLPLPDLMQNGNRQWLDRLGPHAADNFLTIQRNYRNHLQQRGLGAR